MNKTLIIAAVAALALAGGYLALAPRPVAQPPVAEHRKGAPLAAVRPAALSANAVLGERAFNAKCATCHGERAAGQDGIAPPLVHRFYEPNHHGDEAFHMAVQNGVRAHHWPFGDMAPVEGLTRADVDAIIAYVRALQRENGIF